MSRPFFPIAPLPVFLLPLDFAIGKYLTAHWSSVTEACPSSFIEGAKKGRQALDTVWPAKMPAQASLDDLSRGAVAVADIKQYYDNIVLILVCSCLFSERFCHSIIAAIVNVHSFVPMKCNVGCSSFGLAARSLVCIQKEGARPKSEHADRIGASLVQMAMEPSALPRICLTLHVHLTAAEAVAPFLHTRCPSHIGRISRRKRVCAPA